MLLEGLLDFGDLKSQQMRSGSVAPSPPQQTLHLYDPVPLLLRQQRPMELQPGLELTMAEASDPPACLHTSLGWDDWSVLFSSAFK